MPTQTLPRPRMGASTLRLSFRWWESLPERTCACGRGLHVMAVEPSFKALDEEGCWDTSCPVCGRVVTVYDLAYAKRQLPRGPAPTRYQREVLGWSEEDSLAVAF